MIRKEKVKIMPVTNYGRNTVRWAHGTVANIEHLIHHLGLFQCQFVQLLYHIANNSPPYQLFEIPF